MNAKQKAHKEQELSKLRAFIRMQGKAISTEDSYTYRVGKFIDFICAREWPAGTTSEQRAEVFLTAEAQRNVAASTQRVAFHAICYYYRHIRKAPLRNVDALRAKRGDTVRQAPTRADTWKILAAVKDSGPYPTRLICHLLYGCGLRVNEALSIRLKDIDLSTGQLVIIEGKGNKDRFVNLPDSLREQLAIQVQAAEAQHKKARAMGVPAKLPNKLAQKYPKAPFQRRWFWLFPQNAPCNDPRGAGRVWWHCLDSAVQRAMRSANTRAGTEGITPHHLRHAWATHSADDGADLRDLQEILGHRDINTTMRYVRPRPERVPSPLDTGREGLRKAS